MPDSVHTARWIAQIADLGWDIHIFAASDGLPHLALRNVTVHHITGHRPKGLDPSVRLHGLWPWRLGSNVLLRVLHEFAFGRFLHTIWLAWLIRWLKPDIVHSLEIQHAGYLTLAARQYA